MHAHDAEWPAMTAAGRAARLDFYDRWTGEFEGLDGAGLSIDDRVDRDLLLGELAAYRFAETELREDTWSPLEWVYMLGDGLFTLIAREFAPLAERLASVAGRLEGIPAVLDAARTLLGSGDRPVARLHTEKAIAQWAGIADLIGDALAEGERAAAAGDAAVVEVMPRLRAAADAARSALDAFEGHLTTSCCRRQTARGAWAATCSRRSWSTPSARPSSRRRPSRPGPGASADAARAEMVRIAREIWPAWCGDAAPPEDDAEAVRRGHRRDRRPASGRRRHPRLLPRGAGPDRGVLPRARRHRPRRRAARDPLDAGLPARVRRGDARLAGSARPAARRRSSR